MAEPYFPGGPVPRTLDQTVDDLSRIGKGLLVGETADILGIPADLVGLYYDMRYGSTPKGIESLIDRYGSEALAKKFMGEEFPEFSFENFGKDENLESAGRMFAPGALLTKAIASARLAARMGKYPPSNGGGGFELATVGGGKLDPIDDVPETASEKLFMTRSDDTGGGAAKAQQEEKFFENERPEIESRLNPDGTIFSNLLNELEKIGDTSSKLSVKKPTMVPKRDSNNNLVRDAAGNIIKEPGAPQIKGIDFTKKPTGAELLAYFKNDLDPSFSKKFGGQGLRDMDGSGLSSRLGKEAVESGLIRYLELNPDEVMTKQKVVNLASLFKPQINITAYSKNEELGLRSEIARLESEITALIPTIPTTQNIKDAPAIRTKQAELDALKARQREYNTHNPWSYAGVQNIKVQDLARGGGALSENNQDIIRKDTLTFLFSGNDGQAALMGRVVDKSSTNEVDKTINEIDDYFKAMGETTSLKELLSGSRHGYAIPNYFGHVRATAFTMKDPVTGREYKALSINEVQSNQAGEKGKALLSEDPKVTKKIQDLLDKRAKLKSEGKALSDGELEQLSRLAKSSGRIDQFNNFNTFLDEIDRGALLDQFKPPKIMTNKTRMDALQIVKKDKAEGTGFVNIAEEKRILQEQVVQATAKADETRVELVDLNNSVQSLKRAMFRTDEKLNRDRLLLSDFKKAKAQISEDILNADSGGGVTAIDRDTNMPRFLSSLFYQNHRHSTGSAGTLAGHLPNGRGFDEFELGRLADMTRADLASRSFDLDYIKQKSKARYGTQGNVDILSEVLSDKNTELADDFKLFELPYNQAEDPGRKVIISDIDMIRDYYSDLQKGLEEGTVDPSTFNRMSKTNPDYQGYILLKKMVNGQEYFRDKDNIKKTISYLMNDRERKLEAGLFKTEVFNKVMNDRRVSEVFESDNMIELRDRLANLNKRTEDMKPFIDEPMTDVAGVADERRKILDDMLTDFGLTKTDLSGTSFFSLAQLEGRSPVADAFKDAAGEVYDEFRRTQRKIPVLSNNLYMRLNPKRVSESDADVIRGTDSQERASLTEAAQAFGMGFSKFFKPKGWNVSDFNKGLSDPQAKRQQIDQIFEEYVEENFDNNATIVESAIAKRGLEQFKKDKKFMEDKVKDAEVIEQDAIMQLEDFNRERDFDAVLNKLRDKLPDDLKESLNKIVEHQKGNLVSQFQQNPPIMNYDQATELMTHSVIKKAKELGYERVVFPSMDAYDDVGQRENLRDGVKRIIYGDTKQKTSYDFAIGKPVTNALKKYGKGYSTAPEIIATKAPLRSSTGEDFRQGQLARIGKKQEKPNAIDEDLHRIVDLTIEEASEKADSRIPRMAKGGIFSKFRKAS